MTIIVENLDVKPEAPPVSKQAPAVVADSKPTSPVDVEKILRKTLERLARVHAS